MTIREIEEQLGIPRATVRYYEREGLLAPARGGNNYRDYIYRGGPEHAGEDPPSPAAGHAAGYH